MARTLQRGAGMDAWWSDLDNAVLTCLDAGPMSPAEIARRLGTSEASATSLLCLLAQEGRVRIALVESQPTVVRDAHRAA